MKNRGIKQICTCLLCGLSLCGLMYLTLLEVEAEITLDAVTYAYSLLGLGGVALVCLCSSRLKLSWNVLDALVLVFGVYIAVNYFFISYVPAETKGVEVFSMFVLYAILRVILSVEGNIKQGLFFVFILCGSYESILGLRQVYGLSYSNHSLFKVTGTFFNPGPYSGYVVAVLAVCTAYLYRHYKVFFSVSEKRWTRLFLRPWSVLYMQAFICGMLSLLILPATLSRAAIVAYFFIVVLLLLQRKNWKFLLSLVGVMLVVGVFLYFLKQGSADGRLLMWTVASGVIGRNWLTGVGFGDFPSAYADGQATFFELNPDSVFLSVASCPEYAFNEYLHIGVELGLIGFVLFLGIVGVALHLLFKHRNPMAYGLVALLVFAFFSYPFSLLPFQILLVLFLAIAACEAKEKLRISLKRQIFTTFGIFIAMGLIYLLIPCIKKKVEATEEFRSLGHLYNNDYYQGADKDFGELRDDLRDNPTYLFAYGRAMNKLERYNESNAILKEGILVSSDPMFYNIIGNNYKALGAFQMAETAYQKAFQILPNRLYPLYLLMQLYIDFDKKEKALLMAEKILEVAPKIKSPATEEMQEKAEQYINEQK